MVLLVELVKEKSLGRSGRKHFSPFCAWMFYTMQTGRPCAPWMSWSLDERQLPINAFFSLLWSNCLPSPMTSASNLLNNSELKCEQDHEYFLNRLPFNDNDNDTSEWGYNKCHHAPRTRMGRSWPRQKKSVKLWKACPGRSCGQYL